MLHIAEGAHHPGDVAQRRVFRAPLLQAVAWFAFEIDDDEVVAGHENLAQMIVAVNADLLAWRRLRRALLDALQDLRALREHGFGAPLIRRGNRVHSGGQLIQRAARLVQGTLAVGIDVSPRKVLRRERRIVRGLAKRRVQLGGSLRQDANQREICLVRIGRQRVARRCGSILLEMPPHIFKGIGPAIALIGDVSLQHRQQARLAVIGNVFEHARQRRTVRKVNHLGEIQAHLEFRIHSDAHAAIALEHQLLAHIDDGIRAGSARPLDRQRLEIGTGNLRKRSGGSESQLAGRHGDFAAGCHGRDNRAAEQLIRESIAHHTHIGLLANLRHRGGR